MARKILSALPLLALCYATHATDPRFEKEQAWFSVRDLNYTSFVERYTLYRNQGFIMIDLDAYPTPSGLLYSMVWEKNKDNRDWKLYSNLTDDQYRTKWEQLRDNGYRPTDIESYRTNNGQRYDGIWVKNLEDYAWSSKRGMTKTAYEQYITEQRALGKRMVDMEMYETNSGIRYSAIWVSNSSNIDWKEVHGLGRDAYQNRLEDLVSQGYRVTNFDSYTDGSTQRYAFICEKRNGFGYQVRSDRTELEYANLWREYRDRGYRIVDFECYSTPQGLRYAGVWLENNRRYHYEKKDRLDSLINNYRNINNVIPGISVAIIKNGEMLYRRGFGYADKERKRVAHGETIYLAASVSKVIGGTIAVKLHDEGRLRNGRTVNLDFNRTTRSYLTNVRQTNGTNVSLPARHTHTLAQLYSHLGCIQHYEGPEPASNQYNLAIDALPQIWNAAFVNNCAVGAAPPNYSTHAHTYLAAVLETVTGQRAAELIRNEIAVPYHLESMRALYTTASIPNDYDRAIPYQDNNNPTNFDNNSWKIFGGGIEMSTTDLAWFGWKVLNGEIVRPAARDNILWTRVSANTTFGIAWDIQTISGKRVAQHGGSWTGAHSYIRIYRDDGLIIAIMSNRDNHKVDDLSGLARKIAEIVL